MKTYNHRRIIIWAAALWIYAAITISLKLGDNAPIPLFVIGTFIPFIGLYLFLLRNEAKNESSDVVNRAAHTRFLRWYFARVTKTKPGSSTRSRTASSPSRRGGLIGETTPKMFAWEVLEGFVAVLLAIILALATVGYLFDPDLKRELTTRWTNCARDESKVATLPVNKILDYRDAKITVHNVTYNIPQDSKHPTGYSHECQKATLIEVTIEQKAVASDDRVKLTGFSLENKDQGNYDWSPHPETSTDEYDYYADREDITFIDRDIRGEASKAQGWLVFSVREDNSNQESTLTYGEYGDDTKPSIVLPVPN